jgi:hypothetical protein
MTPQTFTIRCLEITSSLRGHEAHRALDLLTNDVLRALGYGEGVAVFEASVAHWHAARDPYPYSGPCPNCEIASVDGSGEAGETPKSGSTRRATARSRKAGDAQ